MELEHGTRFKDANVTNNHPLLTGKIVLAHLKETMDYYQRLDVAELEGDLLKAMAAKDLTKAADKYRKLLKAKLALAQAEAPGDAVIERRTPGRKVLRLPLKLPPRPPVRGLGREFEGEGGLPPASSSAYEAFPWATGQPGPDRKRAVVATRSASLWRAVGERPRSLQVDLEFRQGAVARDVAVHPGRGGGSHQRLAGGVDGLQLGQQVRHLPQVVFLMVSFGQVEGAGRQDFGVDRTFQPGRHLVPGF